MKNLRKHGNPPFRVAVIHGGPGAPGEMAPVARDLSANWGILEPLQTVTTVEAQIEELKTTLAREGHLPLTLIGFSWGAWLSFMFAANHPTFTHKLILVGSGPYEERYARDIMRTRLSRLAASEKTELISLMQDLSDPAVEDENVLMARVGTLISKADSYDPLPHEDEVLECRFDMYQGVWEGAKALRDSGRLLEFGRRIECPVVAIHGDYDPHPSAGVRKPLSLVLKEFRFILLPKCGHCPWIERHARDRFYRILRKELL